MFLGEWQIQRKESCCFHGARLCLAVSHLIGHHIGSVLYREKRL